MPILNPSNDKDRKLTWDPAAQLHPKQLQCFDLLANPESDKHILLFGGSLGGGKSHCIAFWILFSAYVYSDTRWVIVRKQLDQLKLTTIHTLIKLAERLGITLLHDKNEKIFTLENGSTIHYMGVDVAADPELVGLGSTEFSGGAIDEAAQCPRIVMSTLLQRFRYNLTAHGLKGKLLMTCNPSQQSWLYPDFYCLWEKGLLPPSWEYIPSLVTDNPTLMAIPGYLDSLQPEAGNLTMAQHRSRVLGDWHYSEDDDGALFVDADLRSCFNDRSFDVDLSGKFITCDVGGEGANADRTVIAIWQGMSMIDCVILRSCSTTVVAHAIQGQMVKHGVPAKHVAVDALGIGVGVCDQLGKGVIQFKANHSPNNKGAFASLKDELFYKLSEVVSRHEIRFDVPFVRDELITELVAHKRANAQRDIAQKVSDKKLVSRAIGRSPDLADVVMMRMYWLYKKRSYRIEVQDFGSRAA